MVGIKGKEYDPGGGFVKAMDGIYPLTDLVTQDLKQKGGGRPFQTGSVNEKSCRLINNYQTIGLVKDFQFHIIYQQ